jgi:hypothetical protein
MAHDCFEQRGARKRILIDLLLRQRMLRHRQRDRPVIGEDGAEELGAGDDGLFGDDVAVLIDRVVSIAPPHRLQRPGRLLLRAHGDEGIGSQRLRWMPLPQRFVAHLAAEALDPAVVHDLAMSETALEHRIAKA